MRFRTPLLFIALAPSSMSWGVFLGLVWPLSGARCRDSFNHDTIDTSYLRFRSIKVWDDSAKQPANEGPSFILYSLPSRRIESSERV